MKRRGFKFVGPTIVYAWMQAVGIVNDHSVNCYRGANRCDRARAISGPQLGSAAPHHYDRSSPISFHFAGHADRCQSSGSPSGSGRAALASAARKSRFCSAPSASGASETNSIVPLRETRSSHSRLCAHGIAFVTPTQSAIGRVERAVLHAAECERVDAHLPRPRPFGAARVVADSARIERARRTDGSPCCSR